MKNRAMYRAINFLILLACLSILILPSAAQDEPNSIFAEDTCAPPCWFGLIPGESRAEDVEQLIANYAIDDVEVYGLFDEESQLLITGVYEFTLFEWEFNTIPVQIQMQDSLVYLIKVSIRPIYGDTIPNDTEIEENISLNDTLSALGEPDSIYFHQGGNLPGHHSDNFYMIFAYLESRLRIEFQNTFPVFGCNLQTIRDTIFIYDLTYFSPDAANDLSTYVGHDELQPALTALHLGDAIVIPETWQEVMNGEREESCWRMPTERDDTITAPLIYEEPETPRSLFEEDTCAPPCWMGLTPGESTAEDVANFIQTPNTVFREWIAYDDSIFDEQTGLMLSGGYRSKWILDNRDDVAVLRYLQASFSVTDGIVGGITIFPNRTILLRDVLEKLGTPTTIRISRAFDFTVAGLYLIYSDLNTTLIFTSIRNCSIGRMSNNFWVDNIIYSTSSSTLQFDWYETPVVPMDIWQSWLRGEVGGGCYPTWEDLSEEGG